VRRPTGLLRQLDCLWDYFVSGGGGSGGVGPQGPPGADGDSAYEVAVANGFQGSETAWLASLKGDKGDPGQDGADSTVPGPKGDRGDVGPAGSPGSDGNDGQNGVDGADGASAYEVAVANGFVGTVGQWLASLVGAKGDKGDRGDTGLTGPAGSDGAAGSDGNDGAPGVDGKTVRSGSGAPAAGLGADGDFYIRTDTNAIYGPKTAGAWGSPTSLVGPQGIQGVPGNDGVRTASTAFGYSTGAGGTVTQATSKSTAVTLNKLTGEITMNAAALAAGAVVTFTLNNNQAAVGDQILTTHHSGGTIGPYLLNGRVTGAGVCSIAVRNTSAGSLSETIVIKFSVIKAVTA